MLLALSDEVLMSILSLIGLTITNIIGAVLVAKINKKSEVATTLDKTTIATTAILEEISKTGKSVHLLVNSAMQAQKQLLATTARALATRDPSKENMAAANLAESELREHVSKQAEVDAQGKP